MTQLPTNRAGTPMPTPDRLLDAIPVINCAIRVESKESGAVLYVPLEARWWMAPPVSWVFPVRREHGFALDAIGTEVFNACDGKQSCEELIESFAEKHRMRFHEARVAVVKFLGLLVQRKLVALVFTDDGAEAVE